MLESIIRTRQTWKVLGDPADPLTFPPGIAEANLAVVKHSIAIAGFAPFHYDRGVGEVAEPWRVHVLPHPVCRQIAIGLPQWFELKRSNKLPPMLAACGCVVIVNWLPQFRSPNSNDAPVGLTIDKAKQIEIDDEHLQATSAMVQNLLLLLTEQGLGSYWSSGGQLASPEMFHRLGINKSEKLAAAIFVEFPDGVGPVSDRLAGKNRALRSPADKWVDQCDELVGF
jgi:nitroreductase